MELVRVDEARPDSHLYTALKQGNILLFDRPPWEIPAADQEFLRGISQTDRADHKNVAYRPESDKVTGLDPKGLEDPEKLRAILRRFSQAALGFLRQFVPRYMEGCRIDYASFRSVEEEGRDLAFKKRNDLLHIDAFPTRPTGGDLILRTFVNFHPNPQPGLAHLRSIWPVSERARPPEILRALLA